MSDLTPVPGCRRRGRDGSSAANRGQGSGRACRDSQSAAPFRRLCPRRGRVLRFAAHARKQPPAQQQVPGVRPVTGFLRIRSLRADGLLPPTARPGRGRVLQLQKMGHDPTCWAQYRAALRFAQVCNLLDQMVEVELIEAAFLQQPGLSLCPGAEILLVEPRRVGSFDDLGHDPVLSAPRRRRRARRPAGRARSARARTARRSGAARRGPWYGRTPGRSPGSP